MDFGLQPPAGFELGHTQEYYKAKLPRFHVTDEPWGKTFTGGIVESFGQSGTVSGGFDGDVVTALAIGISEDSTLCGVPLFQPRVSDCLCAGAWFTGSPRIGRGMPRLVG
ncbi:hypothetical protein CGLAU_01180 [Corynebacterium glaucum]|uniref:Uncharacterized protein n=1 Tax=Corynebacterium glaucum TaxID=187491 RepID=A0A1Q2HTP9_9CORY|nr:hypothetical protein CGLAU_01180 [Corynebacterium glaucum]